MTREIKLTNCDKAALVSDEDYEYLNQFKWHRMATGYPGSTLGYGTKDGKKHGPETMPRIVVVRACGEIPDGYEVDHANQNKLDCTRENLRICVRMQNISNKSFPLGKGCLYRGVAPHGNRWKATISIENKSKHLGCFVTQEAAAAAYNRAARERFGEFAMLNDVPDDVADAPTPMRFNNRKGSSKYRGVFKNRDKWVAQISRKGYQKYLGTFATEIEAARAYDAKARELFGDAAPLNFPDEVEVVA